MRVEESSVNFNDLLIRLNRIEETLSVLAEGLGRKRRNLPHEFIPQKDAAAAMGRTVEGLRSLLKRERAKPDGFSVRRIPGGIHRADFERFLEHLGNRGKRGRGAVIREALDHLEGW